MCCNHGYNEEYHMEADSMMEKLFARIQNPSVTITSTLCYIRDHLKRFPEQQQSNAYSLALNVLFCHYGDKVKKELKDSNMDSFLFECYKDIQRNNLNTNNLKNTQDRLKAMEQSLCPSACEWTAFNCRLMGSWCLQNAWTTKHDVKTFYKRTALECFRKCKEHLQQLREQYPTCMYLTVLYIKASTCIIFLEEKLCWFLFSRVNMIHRFDQHKPEMGNMITAELLIRVAKHEASRIEEGSSWDYQIKYKLLVAEFFLHCRIAQRKEQNTQRRAIAQAEKILRQLQTHYLHDINCGDWDMMSDLLEHLKEQLNWVIIAEHRPELVSAYYSRDSSGSRCLDKNLSDLSGLSSSSTVESLSEDCV